MTRRTTIAAAWLAGLCLAAVPAAAEEKDEEGWVKLFNGKDLTGWEQRNGTATYRVEDGAVVGKTSEGSPNSFLCTKKEYGDFELRFEVKLGDGRLNSGVQIRSKSKGDTKDGRVHGPQVEISTDGMAGFIDGEALPTGWLSTDKERNNPRARAAFKKGEWNRYHVKAQGKSIKTWVNGVPCADLVDERSGMKSGFIGLQVHGIGKGEGPYEVRWRNIAIKELK
jgi:3-keto-disaccharide hydrolase